MSFINNYKVLHNLSEELISNIKLVLIFGETGNEVLIVTNDDKVFAFGDNKNGCLGLGHNNAIKEPLIINELSNKHIINICFGQSSYYKNDYNYVIALSSDGNCYSWGYNSCGQLGNGTTITDYKPNQIMELKDKNIIDISCGSGHSLVLTKSGEVFAFGNNDCGQIGSGTKENQLLPNKVYGFDNQRVIAISCGDRHSLALTEKKYVLSWGRNSCGQLGIANNLDQNRPKRIVLIHGLIKRIVCGLNHSLLLSIDGDIYGFGCNRFGQLGNNKDENNENIPIKVDSSVKFSEIASNFMSNTSIAVSKRGYCYVWGQVFFGKYPKPEETQFKSIYEVLSFYSMPKITFKPMFNKKESQQIIANNIILLFDDEKYSDLRIKIFGKYIYVHKCILQSRCQHFQSMLSHNWIINTTNEIEMTHYSYNVFYSFLKYIYTDCVDIEFEEVMDLLDLSHSYLEEELKRKCILIIAKHLSVENVCHFYKIGVKYESENLQNICIEFSINNYFDVSIDKTFQEMQISFQTLISKEAKRIHSIT